MHTTFSFIGTLAFVATSALSAQRPAADADRLVRYEASAKAPERWVVGRAEMTVGGAVEEGPSLLVDVVGAFLLNGDRLIIADGKSSELRIFAYPSGRHLSTFGRRGPGPGEIDDLWSVWRTSRTVIAEDAAGKATVFTIDGKFVRTLPRVVDSSGRRAERLGMIDASTALVRVPDIVPAMAPGESRIMAMQLMAVSPEERRLIVRGPHGKLLAPTTGRPRGEVFGARSVAAVVGTRVCTGFSSSYIIACYAKDGTLLSRTERVSVTGRPVSATLRDEYIAAESTANLGPRNAAYVARLRASVSYARTLPLFGEFVAASNGDLWVGPFVTEGPVPMKRSFPREATQWSVYGTNGKWKADVELPARFQLMSVDGMRAVGVMRDADDAESVVVFALIKR